MVNFCLVPMWNIYPASSILRHQGLTHLTLVQSVFPVSRKVLLCSSMRVARACLGSRQLQYQPTSRGNFPNHRLENLATDGKKRSVLS